MTKLVRAALLLDYNLEPQPRYADVRQFAKTDVGARSCSGVMLGRWLISASSEIVLREPTPWAPDPPGVICELALQTLVLNFACTDAVDARVIEVVEISGRTERAIYELPGSLRGSVGGAIGPPQVLHQKRLRNDLCLPEGWQPTVAPITRPDRP